MDKEISFRCHECGEVVDKNTEICVVVNEGTKYELVLCEHCATKLNHKYVVCNNCGRWFSSDVIHTQKLSKLVSFTRCPCCSNDMEDGCTLEEKQGEIFFHKYSVIVDFGAGYHRGYVIEAEDQEEMMNKLMKHIGRLNGYPFFHSICVSEIMLKEDFIG